MTPHGILETILYATDLVETERFYTDVVGLTVVSREPDRHVFMRCGRGMFLVFDPRTTQGPPPVIDGVPIPTHGTVGQGHIAFAVTEAELDTWAARLAERHVAIEARIAWPNGGRSIYVRDPAGNSVEFATPRLWGIAEEALA